NVGYLGLGRPEVTLRETKGGFRRGTEKLPLQAKLSGSSSQSTFSFHMYKETDSTNHYDEIHNAY
ncbi:hypothetical protein, partial [Ureibacillus thermosphaericus]|uniref:hypothetical protein n=1 Tax=Ureibacillus thermosphaericus TaxID=51173 RepID=UPI0030C95F2A